MTSKIDADLAYVADMLGDSGDQRIIAIVGLDVIATLIRKNHDYGSSAFQCPVLAPNLPPDAAILCRASDKVARINRLAQSSAQVDESLADTIKDLAGYCILWLVQQQRQQPDA